MGHDRCHRVGFGQRGGAVMPRASWVDYFLGIAEQVATRATCDRRHVGAVMVLNNMILSTGFNGSAAGLDHCDDVGHDLVDSHCQKTVHAEINAICQAARHGVALEGATLYCTDLPCWSCFKALVNAGIHRVFYREHYRPDPRVLDAADKTKMFLAHIPRDTPDTHTDALLASRERAKQLTEILAQRKPRPPEELVGAMHDTVHHELGTVHQGVKVAPRVPHQTVDFTPEVVQRLRAESEEIGKAMRPRIEAMWKVDPADAAKPCRSGVPSHLGPTWRQVELARAFNRGLHRLDFTAPEIEAEIQAELDLDAADYEGLEPCGQCHGDGWVICKTMTMFGQDIKTKCLVCHGTGVDPESLQRHQETSGEDQAHAEL